ncbi:hypothetical protein HYU50_01980 [Candidatus Woesearchaeota archaeon]|nr:hypothetical protein [Candidatus Woesearchaeota archaeon]
MKNQNIILDFENNSNNGENKDYSEELAEFLGWHVGDGCISINKRHYQYTLTGDIVEEYPFYKKVVVPTFNRLFTSQLNNPAKLRIYKSVGVCGIYVFQRDFIQFLQSNFNLKNGKKYAISVPFKIKTLREKICFIRGLFDTDGSIYFCKSYNKRKKKSIYNAFHYRPKIKLATISYTLIEEVYSLLIGLGFHPRIQKPIKQRKNEYTMHSVIVDSKSDVLKWIKDIGFKNLKHVTKVNIWEKSGFCPPYTTLNERLKVLNGRLNPLTFYPNFNDLPLSYIKTTLYS